MSNASSRSEESNEDDFDFGEEDDDDDEDNYELELGPTVYSDIIITCSRRKTLEIVSSAFILTLNLLIQMSFAVIMGKVLAKNEFAEVTKAASEFGDLNLIKEWVSDKNPTGGGHCKYSTLLSWWTCNRRAWSWEAEELDNMNDYTEVVAGTSLMQGTFFGMIALFSWMGLQFKEVKEILAYLRLLRLPQTSERMPDYTFDKKSGGRLNSLAVPVKILIVVVAVVRLVICIFLTIYGAQFLINTLKLQDFILNCVALVFVYEFDELFFETFINRHKRRRVKTLQPVEIPRGTGSAMLSGNLMVMVIELSGIFVCIALTCIFGSTLQTFGQEVKSTLDSVCGAASEMDWNSAAGPDSQFECSAPTDSNTPPPYIVN